MAKLLQTAIGKKYGYGHRYGVSVSEETIARLERIYAARANGDMEIQRYMRMIVEEFAKRNDPDEEVKG
jgi:hypothetical protein